MIALLPFASRHILSAEGQDPSGSVVRITENTTLHVFNNGSMETAGGSGVEFIPFNAGTADTQSIIESLETVEDIPVTRVKTENVAQDEENQPPAEDDFITIAYIARGTLLIAPDGTWTTEDGGQVEFIRMPRSEYEAMAQAAPTESEVIEAEIVPAAVDSNDENAVPLSSSCTDYQAISYFTRGSSLKRTIDYCVNSSQNEIVKRYRLKNIGSVDSDILAKVLLTRTCPPGGITTVVWESTGGPWIIAPNATLEFTPWVELTSGSGKGGVYEDWLNHTDTESCFG
jgi:hypothetical protein